MISEIRRRRGQRRKPRSRPSFWMPREGDWVNYHSIIGGPITSSDHIVESVGELPSPNGPNPVAWISGVGMVSADALSPMIL